MTEKVYLVGAGPGDPELLTRKAWRVLQSANVELHDDLVPQELLRVLPPTAQVVNVGKRCGVKGISQAEINAFFCDEFFAFQPQIFRCFAGHERGDLRAENP